MVFWVYSLESPRWYRCFCKQCRSKWDGSSESTLIFLLKPVFATMNVSRYRDGSLFYKFRGEIVNWPTAHSLRWPHAPSTASGLSKEGYIRTVALLGRCTDWSESLLVTQVLLWVLSCAGSFLLFLTYVLSELYKVDFLTNKIMRGTRLHIVAILYIS